jgi:Family of unknown function (DUF5946)
MERREGLKGASAGSLDPCPSCGASLGGRAGCQHAFDELSAAAWQDPTRAAVHNLVVDTYAMQHPEEYGRSAKSYLQHLAALCCALEHPGDVQLYWSIARSFEHTPPAPKPPLLRERGRLTIADVQASTTVVYPARVRDWAADVWLAYRAQHHLAHERLDLVQRQRSPPR